MNEPISIIEKQVKQFCARIGTDPLLVQGPGGNVSWKDNDVLWIKSSGKWLAKACDEEIFVPVSLSYLQEAISNKNFTCTPLILGDTKLRPSIETMLHALMPHKVIAHLHAVEALAHLVRKNAETRLAELINDSVKWVFVDYYKPGAELAASVSAKLKLVPDAEVIFLKNHGIVIGAPDTSNLDLILKTITKLLFTKPFLSELIQFDFVIKKNSNIFLNDFAIATDPEINRLSTNSYLFSRIQNDWALYPDHVVFLGDRAIVVDEMREMFYTIENGGYSNKLFELFGKERVERELEEFLSHKFFKRFGGGIGLTRLARAYQMMKDEHTELHMNYGDLEKF